MVHKAGLVVFLGFLASRELRVFLDVQDDLVILLLLVVLASSTPSSHHRRHLLPVRLLHRTLGLLRNRLDGRYGFGQSAESYAIG